MDKKEIRLELTESLLKKIQKSAAELGKTSEEYLVNLLEEKFPEEADAEAGMSQAEEDKIKERLKALGYMD